MAVKNYGIHDKWTNINKVNNVDIQSVDGVIENIKVNGEPAGGGGGDFSTVNVTVNDPNALGMLMNGAFPVEGTSDYNFPFINFRAFSDVFGTGKVALYKGNALIDVEIPDEGTITVSGNAEIIIPGRIKVTGDCTITVS